MQDNTDGFGAELIDGSGNNIPITELELEIDPSKINGEHYSRPNTLEKFLAQVDEMDKVRTREFWYGLVSRMMSPKVTEKPNSELFFMAKAMLNSRMTNCKKAGHGSVIVYNRTVVADGYNGVPRGVDHPTFCARMETPSGENYSACEIPCLHSETNAIFNAARLGARTEGATMYVTGEPCLNCAEAIIQAGIVMVCFASGRNIQDHAGLKLLHKTGVALQYVQGD